MKGLVILALTLVAVWTAAEARSQDSIVLRVFTRDPKVSEAKVLAILKKANLEKHGYKLEVINKLTRQPDSKKAKYTKTFYFYKTVPCDKVYDVERELDRLLGGSVIGPSVLRKVKKDVKEKKIADPKETCKAGFEIHFRNGKSCGKKSNDEGDRMSKRKEQPGPPGPCPCCCCKIVK